LSNIPDNLPVAMMFAQRAANASTLTWVVVAICFAAGVFALWFFNSRSRTEKTDGRDTLILESNRQLDAEEELSSRLIAILAAAATAALGRRVVIRRITFINRDTVSGWAEAGRTSIQMSHNLRRTI
jgi:uncharacterized membrane protein